MSNWESLERFARSLLPKGSVKGVVPSVPSVQSFRVSPDSAHLVASALLALAAPRAAGVLLSAPYVASEREAERLGQEAEREFMRQLQLARLGVEHQKAVAPIEVERLRGSLRREEMALDSAVKEASAKKLEAEARKAESEAERQRAKLPVEIAQQIGSLLLRAGDPALSASERGMLIGYARRLMEEYGIDLERYIPSELSLSPRQSEALARAEAAEAQAELSRARAEASREEAESERALREPRVEELRSRAELNRAQIRLIEARELTERVKPDLLRAQIEQIRNNIALGWRNLAIRSRAVEASIADRNMTQLRQLLRDVSVSRAFWEKQALELEKAARTYVEQTVQGSGETAITTTRVRSVDPSQAAELRARAVEARNIAEQYRRLEAGIRKRLGIGSVGSGSGRSIRLDDGTVVRVDEGD